MAEVLIEKFSCGNGGFWGEITLNRPEKKNAINGPLGVGLSDAFDELSVIKVFTQFCLQKEHFALFIK